MTLSQLLRTLPYASSMRSRLSTERQLDYGRLLVRAHGDCLTFANDCLICPMCIPDAYGGVYCNQVSDENNIDLLRLIFISITHERL